ncbi:MAG: hypothetical protein Q7R70_02295 [Candidatus Diapherotrites archaeon]|nr:hypothetical protein [Candidatus Diapherotrites archaeon]
MKKIVVPGEIVSIERKRTGEHVFLQNGRIYSDVLGIVDERPTEVAVVALEGFYIPKSEDVIVGVIASEKATGYMVELNSFTQSFISKKEVREQMKPGYIISARVIDVNELKEAELSQVRVFYGGEIISISPVKIPRVIGKNASMLEVLKRGTNSTILVGRNGWIWAKGGNLPLLIGSIKKIEVEAHLENLTVKLQDFISQSNKSVKFPSKPLAGEAAKPEEIKEVEKLDKEVFEELSNESDFNGN